MKSVLSIALIVMISLISGAFAQTGDHQTYEKDGLVFALPDNWSIAEDTINPADRLILIEGPGDALLIINMFAADGALPLMYYARIYSDAMINENSVLLTRTAGEFGKVEKTADYESVVETFTQKFFWVMNIEFSTTFRRMLISDKVLYVSLVVADESKEQAFPGFVQVSSSIKVPSAKP